MAENAYQEYLEENNILIGRYYESFDIMRVILLALLMLANFGLPGEIGSACAPLLNFSSGAIFTIYGYLVLRDGRDLRVNILRALIATAICFAVYGVLTIGFYIYNGVSPFELLTRRHIFEFVVLNRWPTHFCNSIWMVQSGLYSVIIIYIFRKLKKLDWMFCILLFIFGMAVGELAGLYNFHFLGYSYIQSNCLTRTIPYMLLGRIIHKHVKTLSKWSDWTYWMIFICGLLLAAIEYLGLRYIGGLGYKAHFFGFILMSFALCIWCATRPHLWSDNRTNEIGPYMYRNFYYIFNPVGFAVRWLLAMTGINALTNLDGIIGLAVALLIALLIANIQSGTIRQRKKRGLYF